MRVSHNERSVVVMANSSIFISKFQNPPTGQKTVENINNKRKQKY